MGALRASSSQALCPITAAPADAVCPTAVNAPSNPSAREAIPIRRIFLYIFLFWLKAGAPEELTRPPVGYLPFIGRDDTTPRNFRRVTR